MSVSQEPKGHAVHASIGTLSSLLMCFRRPAYYRSIGRLQASDGAIEYLENILPDRQPYFSDYF